MVPDYMEATSAVERYDILERELRRRQDAKGAIREASGMMVPPRAITEAYLRQAVTHPVVRPVQVQEGGQLGRMMWHDIYEEEVRVLLYTHTHDSALDSFTVQSSFIHSLNVILHLTLGISQLDNAYRMKNGVDGKRPPWTAAQGYARNMDALRGAASHRARHRAADEQVRLMEQAVSDFEQDRAVTEMHHLPNMLHHQATRASAVGRRIAEVDKRDMTELGAIEAALMGLGRVK